ncbi:hypothetical protein R51_01480 [Bacillus safensis]|nr:hypothetical protein B33_17510 [Bacillus safensis]GLF85103.1 hypothetical protein R51_01480 [Bacillus safensis]GMG78009.1 hypothetical protein ShirakiTA10_09710 [Bacillus safensis]
MSVTIKEILCGKGCLYLTDMNEWDEEMEALYEKTITFGAAIYPNFDITSSLSASRSAAFKARHKRSCL